MTFYKSAPSNTMCKQYSSINFTVSSLLFLYLCPLKQQSNYPKSSPRVGKINIRHSLSIPTISKIGEVLKLFKKKFRFESLPLTFRAIGCLLSTSHDTLLLLKLDP